MHWKYCFFLINTDPDHDPEVGLDHTGHLDLEVGQDLGREVGQARQEAEVSGDKNYFKLYPKEKYVCEMILK